MLPSLKAIRAGSLQWHAITASRKCKYMYTIPSLPCLKAMKAAPYFSPVQSKSSFCTSSWPKSRSRYSSRNPGYRLCESHLPPPEDGACNSSYRSRISNKNHSGYRYLSNHGWQRSHFRGRYGYGWRCSDRRSGTDGRPEEDEITDHALWRTRRDFLTKQIANLRKIIDADPFGLPLGQKLPSTDKRDEKDKSDSDILSRKRQEAMAERFSDLKKMIDEDPYGVLFGRRLQTQSPEDLPLRDSMNFGPSKSKGTSSVKNARDLNESVFDPSGPRQKAASRSKSEPPSQNPATESVAEIASQNEEFEFDPITMRKVPKKRSNMTATPHEPGTDKSFSIPVKPFTSPIPNNFNISATSPDTIMQISPQTMPTKPKHPTAASTLSEPERGWLAREGFDAQGHGVDDSSPSLSNAASRKSRKANAHKIESALDRHIKANNMSSDQIPADSSSLKYPVKEITEDDVDLLRPSDVRASAGLCKNVSKPTAAEKQERRSILSSDYERRNNELDHRLEEELAAQIALSKNTNIDAETVESSPKCSKDHPIAVSEIKSSSPSMATTETLNSESESLSSEATSSSQIENPSRTGAQRAHEIDINAQKVAMEALEMREKAGSSQRNIQSVQSREAGEGGTASNIDMFASRTFPQERDQQLAKHKTLISDIRSIYEDRYGIIDANHRQPSIAATEISPVETKLDNTASLEKATNEILEQTTKSSDAERRARDHDQRPSDKGDSVPITSEQPAYSGGPSCREPQDHRVGDQSDTRRQLLREVYETQNLIRELSRRISESQLPRSVPTESLDRPKVPEQSFRQADLNGVEEIVSDKQTKLNAFSKSALIHSDSRSPSNTGSEGGETASIPVSYRILAYDPSTQRVTAAKNTFLTSPASERRLTVAEALSGLANPAKFLPHFASLQNAGYEIVSGSSNLLIFKKTSSQKPLTTSTDGHAPEFKGRYSMHTNPIDGTTPQTGNFASPTGFVNYDSILPTPDSEEGTCWPKYPRAPKPSDRVRREEPVFSGGWRDSQDERVGKWAKFRSRQRRKRRWRTAKRMLWVGSCVAGCCYAAGVASEVLRGGASRKLTAPPDWVH